MNIPTHLEGTKLVRMKPDGSTYAVAAGSSDITSNTIDMAGFDGIEIVEGFGTITAGAVTSMKVQEGAASDGSDAADLASSSTVVADTDDNSVIRTQVFRPQKRYITVVTKRATQNSVIDFMLAVLFAPRVMPVTQDATVSHSKTLYSPDEGTA